MIAHRPPATCPACDVPPRRRYRLSNGARLLQCPNCLLAWWNWADFDAGAFYDKDYFQSTETSRGYDDYASLTAGLQRTAAARLRTIDRVRACSTPDRGLLLDAGCGTGEFLLAAKKHGWQTRGVEVSAYGTKRAMDRGLDVRQAALEGEDLGRDDYDCVTLWDVIEHVRDPGEVLRSAVRALRIGGVLALSTGDIATLCARLCGPKWHLFNLPEHLFFFTAHSLVKMLRARGCQLAAVQREVNWVSASYIWERLTKRFRSSSNSRVSIPARRDFHAPAWTIPATLADVVGIYAIKRTRRP